MRFKKGDSIIINQIGRFSSAVPWANNYEVTDIANGDLYSDQYYVLSAGTQTSMHDVTLVDKQFNFSLKDTLKKL